ncbi:hypothetical protein JI58_03205 [Marinosulfonomonas sp. PRT-SC04]|nr:hypothetical protein JI58_03205 [Marinosulfonomonas sp. PRT-SC04]
MIVRAATPDDAPAMSAILSEILTLWGSERAHDPAHICKFYIEHPDQVSCVVAVSGAGEVLGFQSLKRAVAGNPYGVAVGWGVIGSYVKQGIGRRGVGAALFTATAKSAHLHGLHEIDVTISENNAAALGYYEAMGFRTYRRKQGAVCKCYTRDQ